jgi:hypothetical protein
MGTKLLFMSQKKRQAQASTRPKTWHAFANFSGLETRKGLASGNSVIPVLFSSESQAGCGERFNNNSELP